MIRSFIKDSISEDQEVFAVLCLVYDHDHLDLVHNILDVQHHSQDIILYSSHVHIDGGCIEIIVTKGLYSRLIEVQNQLRVITGGKIVTETIILPVDLLR